MVLLLLIFQTVLSKLIGSISVNTQSLDSQHMLAHVYIGLYTFVWMHVCLCGYIYIVALQTVLVLLSRNAIISVLRILVVFRCLLCGLNTLFMCTFVSFFVL
jgi:hypothetical protein